MAARTAVLTAALAGLAARAGALSVPSLKTGGRVAQYPTPRMGEDEIKETAALDMLDDLYYREVNLEDGGEARVTFVRRGDPAGPKVMLLHGFDSSCLEFRRLLPRLGKVGLDTYAVDMLGWGFSERMGDFAKGGYSAAAKRDALYAFWRAELQGEPIVLAGASLGGAAAIEFAAAYPHAVAGLVLLDAQAGVDGVGPMQFLPTPLARLGVQVLKSRPLRRMANDMSYSDTTLATEDAMRIGRVHTLRDTWETANVDFMQSGGFAPAEKVQKISCPVQVLWGTEDRILAPLLAEELVAKVPTAQLHMVESCGHVPHLEQPDETCQVITEFVKSIAK